MSQIQRAKHIQRTLGTRAAAGYLRNKGYFISTAIRVLARKA